MPNHCIGIMCPICGKSWCCRCGDPESPPYTLEEAKEKWDKGERGLLSICEECHAQCTDRDLQDRTN